MRIIAKKVLREFWEANTGCENQLKLWFREISERDWKDAHEIKRIFQSASILGDNRIVFNIKGNHYRLIVKINYNRQMLWIRFIGTHAGYDKIDANKV